MCRTNPPRSKEVAILFRSTLPRLVSKMEQVNEQNIQELSREITTAITRPWYTSTNKWRGGRLLYWKPGLESIYNRYGKAHSRWQRKGCRDSREELDRLTGTLNRMVRSERSRLDWANREDMRRAPLGDKRKGMKVDRRNLPGLKESARSRGSQMAPKAFTQQV